MRSGASLRALMPTIVKRRLKKLQKVYWRYFRPLYCELVVTPPAGAVLVISPHIDDDVIGCGGVLRQHASSGAKVTSVYLRSGGPVREKEAREAAKLVGISALEFLRWPAGGVKVTAKRASELSGVIEGARPDLIYAPFFLDPHPDHSAATRLLGEAIKRGLRTGPCYLYEVWSPLVPNVLVDITGEAEIKENAINAHLSQAETINMGAGILGLNAYRAEMNRVNGYAEGFLRLRPSELADIVSEPDS